MPSGEHPFDGDMILIKNKNKNKNKIARGTNALDHSFVHAQCVVWGLLTRCGKETNWIVLLSKWRFSLCIQGERMDFQEEKSLEAVSSGQADVSRADTHYSESVSHLSPD